MSKLCSAGFKVAIFMIWFAPFVWAEDFFQAEASFRSQPQAANLVGTLAHDGILWGAQSRQKDQASPLYGFYRLGTRFGGSPSLSGFLQIAPLAPLVFEVQRGFTQRFTGTRSFDCNQIQCLGQIQRTDYSLRLAAAYKEWVFLDHILWRELQTESATQDIFAELENFIVSPGSHRFFQNISLLGYRLPENRMLGLLYDAGVLINEAQNFSAVYSVYRQSIQDWQITLGAGQYKSSFTELNGFSIIFVLSRKWGDSLSLF